MYNKIIHDWNKDKYKILFISGEHGGCGKMYLANQISKNYEVIDILDVNNNDTKKYNTHNIVSLFNKKENKHKLVIIDYEEYKKYKISDHIYKIVILYNKITDSLKNIIKKNYHIHILKKNINYTEIIQSKFNINKQTIYKLLNLFDFNLNKIISYLKYNITSNINEINIDYFEDDTIKLCNNIFKNKYSISEIINISFDIHLISLHILDHIKQISDIKNLNILLKLYENIIISDNIHISYYNILRNYIIYLNIIYPYINYKNKIKNIKYNKYLSKNIIITHLLNINNINIEEYHVNNSIYIPNKIKLIYEKLYNNLQII